MGSARARVGASSPAPLACALSRLGGAERRFARLDGFHVFPAYGAWDAAEGIFFGLYGTASPTHAVPLPVEGWENPRLISARTVAALPAGAVLPVALTWLAEAPVRTDYKVFVHALAPDGQLVAQHDAMPLNDLRPMTQWRAGEPVYDPHGLALPPTCAARSQW